MLTFDRKTARFYANKSAAIWDRLGYHVKSSDIAVMPYRPFGVSKDIPYMVRFKNPHMKAIDGKEFRLLARYPGYCVSSDGFVYNLWYKKYCAPFCSERVGYIFVSLNDLLVETKGSFTKLSHKLVGIEWVDNDDYVTKNIVDHIDEDKFNNNASNLQWISNATNQAKSVYKTIGNNIVVRNIRTGEISIVPGTNAAFKLIGRSHGDSTSCDIKPGRIYRGKNGIFEIKRDSDDTPWMYGPDNIPSDKEIHANPRTDVYYDTYEILDTQTGKIIEAKSRMEIHKLIPSISVSAVHRHISRCKRKPNAIRYLVAGRYLLRLKNKDMPWPAKNEYLTFENKPKQVTIGGVTYNSIREASRNLGLDQKTVKRLASTKS